MDPDAGSPVLEAILENARSRRHLGDRLAAVDARVDTETLVDVVRHGPVLEALLAEPLDRSEIEARLDVSRATSHRFVRWLDEHGLAEKADGRVRLTGKGEAIAEEVLRLEATVRTAGRLAPLLERVCADHQEFVLEPLVDATVTVAGPDDPYGPVERFATLVTDSRTLRGFNAVHMAPPGALAATVLGATETELVDRPRTLDRLLASHPDRVAAARDAGALQLYRRDTLPYALALVDDRVAIGGYDDATGQLAVLVDTDAPIAREWAERVYASVRADATAVDA